MPAIKDITGQRFGRLVALKRHSLKGDGPITWECLCDCGNKTNVLGASLREGKTKSCGCIAIERIIADNTTHGLLKKHKSTYNTWTNMKARCTNPNRHDYCYYGARGVTYDPRWEVFENFFKDMGPKPNDYLTIERIDTNGDYYKDNCRWATWTEQNNNKRNNAYLTYNGETKRTTEWLKEFNMAPCTFYRKLAKGWNLEKIFTTKVHTHRFLTFQEETLSVPQWARKLGLSSAAIHTRLWRGWSVEKALSTPLRVR